MMKPSFLLVAALATTALAGCSLYFGEEESDDSWTYCGADGQYNCSGDDCYWEGPTCTSGGSGGSGSGGAMGGFACNTNTDCAAGCYCDAGTCNEAGFCTQDSDCGNGFTCNESRSSCEPEYPPTSCMDDSGCPPGSVCDTSSGKCTATCACTTDAEATNAGYGYCDENRGTCVAGDDPSGTCTGAVTCNLGRPSCPQGQVALIYDGCYTGQCAAINSCGEEPGCAAYTHEADCQAAGSCTLSYTGINCRMPDNTPCVGGSSTQCVCQSYQFASCNDMP